MSTAIIIVENLDNPEEPRVLGPFPSRQAASDWGFRNIEGKAVWYWLPMEAPIALVERSVA